MVLLLNLVLILLSIQGHTSAEVIRGITLRKCEKFLDLYGLMIVTHAERGKALCTDRCFHDPSCYALYFSGGLCHTVVPAATDEQYHAIENVGVNKTVPYVILKDTSRCLDQAAVVVSRAWNVTLAFDGFDTLNYTLEYLNYPPLIDGSSGFIGNGVSFDVPGIRDLLYVDYNDANSCPMTSFLCPNGTASYSVWVLTLPNGDNYNTLYHGAHTRLRIRDNVTLEIYHHILSGSNFEHYSFSAKNTYAQHHGKWTHIVTTFRPTNAVGGLKIYLNGFYLFGSDPANTYSAPTQYPVPSNYDPNDFTFGTSPGDSVTNARLLLDEFHAWDVELSGHDVYLLYNSYII